MIHTNLIPLYITIILFIIVIVYWIKFKVSNPFWSKQPVIHLHNLLYKYNTPNTIWDDFYIAKYVNHKNISTYSWKDLKYKSDIQKLISNHFYKENSGHYDPSLNKHIAPYYDNDRNAYTSLYFLENILVGSILNRTLRIHINKSTFNISYIDYLCVHKGYRKKSVAPELIQTHEYFQRTKSNKKCKVSMFKKEGVLHNFTPLTQYNTSTYNISSMRNVCNQHNLSNLPNNYECVTFSLSIKNLLLAYLEKMRMTYSCFVIPPFETLIEIIERKSIHIYAIIDHKPNEIIALYFFRNSGLYATCNSTRETTECFATMYDTMHSDIFCNGFFHIVNKYLSEYTLLHLEEIGSSIDIANAIKQFNIAPKYNVPCAYYLYNYSNNSINNSDCAFIL